MLEEASKALSAMKRMRMGKGDLGFLIGEPGLLTVSCLVAKSRNTAASEGEIHTAIERLLAMNTTSGCEDELLYGKAGYLYCLHLLHKEFPEIDDNLTFVQKLAATAKALVTSGRAQATKGSLPLMWRFYGTFYHGAAHGHAGVLAMLLHSWRHLDANDKEIVKETLDRLLDLGPCKGGNLPTAFPSPQASCHWCHGAPGLVATLVAASQALGDPSYLQVAESLAPLLWQHGITLRGTGLCHGISGNAYSFLSLYRATHDTQYLNQAHYFARAALSPDVLRMLATYPVPGRAVTGVPDMPFSLMEGSAGEICFFADLLHPETARFPAWEI
eukprot:TRINITY_DN7760_c0_g2_i1.p1 TRINITY_DN7760_c0_g2~~TRINITY_DN7760_c0_g2_i1.p1  ORF type:complete len:330 (+),score=52.25 TRINITY_DN7760_c0_g2_i1:449-1438(+)